jgi:hypothetical protein
MLIMGTQVSNELKCGAAFLASYRVSRAISRLAQLICASIPLSFSLSFFRTRHSLSQFTGKQFYTLAHPPQ